MSDDASLHLSDPLPFPRQFRSKVDWWVAALMLSPFAVVGALIVAGLGDLWVLVVLLAPQALLTWILGRTDYTIDEQQLVARSGPFRFTVPVASIRSLVATRNPLSSPALSIDRIAVGHTSGRLLVSPRNKAGFVRAVLAIAPHVTVTGLPGATDANASDPPESSFSVAALVPAVLVGVLGLAFGAWQFYAGTRAPEATIDGNTLSISGLYSTTIHRSEIIRISLEDTIDIGRRVNGFGGGRHLRGFFEVAGLGRSRLFVSRDSSPFLVIRTKTQPVVISFDDPSRTRALHADLQRAWGLPATSAMRTGCAAAMGGHGDPPRPWRVGGPWAVRAGQAAPLRCRAHAGWISVRRGRPDHDRAGAAPRVGPRCRARSLKRSSWCDDRFLSPVVPVVPEADLAPGASYPRMTAA